MADPDRALVLADVRDTLAGIAAVTALLSGSQPSEVDRTAALRLTEQKATSAALKLERLKKPAYRSSVTAPLARFL